MVKTALPLEGAQVGSLVRELRSCMPHSMAKKKKANQVETTVATLDKNTDFTKLFQKSH